jgi:multidrug transporter EmrE-like cation transporter
MQADAGSRGPISRGRKTAIFIFVAVVANSFGNLLLAEAMEHMPSLGHVALAHYVERLLGNPFLIPGVMLTSVYTLSQLSLFSWADLSFVVPCTASSYIVTTLLGEFILGEHVALARWMGVLLIFCGIVLVARTPTNTKGPEDIPR